MKKMIDSRYRFSFLTPSNRIYSRQIYWENLYVFSHRGERILATDRIVPYSSTHYALYEALKNKNRKEVFKHLLPGLIEESPSMSLIGAPEIDLVRSVIDILPAESSPIAEEIIELSEGKFEKAISEALVRNGLQNGLDTFNNPEEVDTFQRRFSDPTDILHSLAQAEGKDTGIVNLSFRIDAVLKDHIREGLETNISDQALARYSDFEFDIYKRLYSNPKYLAFVKQVIDAKGGYVSPVVRDFLSFYIKCLNLKLNEQVRQEHADPEVLRKRIEGLLGQVKGNSHYFLDYHELTILGYVQEGGLVVDSSDPDSTDASFKVDPDVDISKLIIREIQGNTLKFLVRKTVSYTFNRNHNIKVVQFVDELKIEQNSSNLRGITSQAEKCFLQVLNIAIPLEKISPIANMIKNNLSYICVSVLIMFAFAIILIMTKALWMINSSP